MSDDLDNDLIGCGANPDGGVNCLSWLPRAIDLCKKTSEGITIIVATLSLYAFVAVVAPRVPPSMRSGEYGAAAGIVLGFHLGVLGAQFFSLLKRWISFRVTQFKREFRQRENRHE